MRNRFTQNPRHIFVEANIYADRSSLILDWLLREGIGKAAFSLREVATEVGISLGHAQRIFKTLIFKGYIQTRGVGTAKKFCMKNPVALLESWTANYSITNQCKIWTYQSSLPNQEAILDVLKRSKLHPQLALALHSAANAYGVKNTNLTTTELYLLNPELRPELRPELEELLQLEPKERGYEVLLISPYYKSLLERTPQTKKELRVASPLLTFLDLYHFPLRGQEQAEYMAKRIPELKRIVPKT